MSKEDLREKMDRPEVVVLDVRKESDYQDSDLKIQGAVRVDPTDIDAWLSRYPRDRELVLYCA
jgi:rhodanese-related sulfurtransferase